MQGNGPDQALWENLERIRITMDLGDWDFAQYLGIKPHEYVRLRREKREPSSRAIFRLLDHLPLTFDQFMMGQIDFDAIESHSRGNTLYVPERFLVGARSRRRTSINILAYLEERYGWKEKMAVLKHFHVHPGAFRDPDTLINVHFNVELCTYLKHRGYSEAELFQMGAYSTVINRSGPIGKALGKERSTRGVYERLFTELIDRFDENFHYRIVRLSSSELTLRIERRAETCEMLGCTDFGTRESCIVRTGVGAAIPNYIGLPLSRVTHHACMHAGDAYCEITFRFALPEPR